MRTTIDGAGRIVVPKALRDELGLTGGQELEIATVDGVLEVSVPPTPVRLVRRDGVLVAEPAEGELPPLTAEQVRETLERVRR
jgi:AbrB family looped-hinge helix DNA binding protein